ncbi:MAG: Grx4 family monothiol glutaredoxin [Alcaligenaceae bacterium]|nr:Grx4 family monothiol glutaredoxin [Alcaligenaceae bacterium]
MSTEVRTFIDETVKSHPVVLFMKGSAQFPQCGFSGKAISILRDLGVRKLVTINVLDDQEVREEIKSYSNWPTIPQLYVNGEFVGGSDIMDEMKNSGELKTLLDESGATSD